MPNLELKQAIERLGKQIIADVNQACHEHGMEALDSIVILAKDGAYVYISSLSNDECIPILQHLHSKLAHEIRAKG